jgi:hypothetical protein
MGVSIIQKESCEGEKRGVIATTAPRIRRKESGKAPRILLGEGEVLYCI